MASVELYSSFDLFECFSYMLSVTSEIYLYDQELAITSTKNPISTYYALNFGSSRYTFTLRFED